MSTIILNLPDVKTVPNDRPSQCRHCGSPVLQSWGTYRKPVRDSQEQQVVARRYHCVECGRTFRHYPSGVSSADQTARLVHLAALMWALGLSLRQVVLILAAFGVKLSRMSVWRDGQQIGTMLKQRRQLRVVPVLGVDGAWLRAKGANSGVMVAVDLGRGEPVDLAVIEEDDVEAVREWLQDLVQELGVEVLVTDDRNNYRPLAQELGLAHQICRFHTRRWVGRTLRQLRPVLSEKWQGVVDEVDQIVEAMSAQGAARLAELWEQIPDRHPGKGQQATALWRLRRLMVRLSDHWTKYRLYQLRDDVPSTNNGTERSIGNLKVRSRSVRGFKTDAGIETMFQLCGA